MKRLIAKCTLLLFVAVMTTNVIMLRGKDELSLHSHEINVGLSYQRLKALKDSSKIVIIAGSNGGFSINSRMISEAFHRPVVNTSTHAGIGVRMQFELYKELLQKGDVVIFCPEYPNYGEDKNRLYGGSILLRVLSSHMPSAYRKISLPQWLSIYRYIGIHYAEVKKHAGIKKIEGPYSAQAVNKYGDIECERLHQDTIKHNNVQGKIDKDLLRYYKYIHTYTKDRDIKLVFLPPTFMRSNYVKSKNQVDSISMCLRRNGIAYQSEPADYSFPDSLYFDTPYHMTQSGADIRTEVLIKDLRRILNNRVE